MRINRSMDFLFSMYILHRKLPRKIYMYLVIGVVVLLLIIVFYSTKETLVATDLTGFLGIWKWKGLHIEETIVLSVSDNLVEFKVLTDVQKIYPPVFSGGDPWITKTKHDEEVYPSCTVLRIDENTIKLKPINQTYVLSVPMIFRKTDKSIIWKDREYYNSEYIKNNEYPLDLRRV